MFSKNTLIPLLFIGIILRTVKLPLINGIIQWNHTSSAIDLDTISIIKRPKLLTETTSKGSPAKNIKELTTN